MPRSIDTLLEATLARERLRRNLLSRLPLPARQRVSWDLATRKPQYLYGLYLAVSQASAIECNYITAIEFGVGGGGGLLSLRTHAEFLSQEFGVAIDVIGFDSGSGLPEVSDPRDLPFIWQPGDFPCEVTALEAEVLPTELVLGDVRETVNEYFSTGLAAPIAFISFDLDLYTATAAALSCIPDLAPPDRLPRIICYFDDLIGNDLELIPDFGGEWLAIEEFNRGSHGLRLSKLHGLHLLRSRPAIWNDEMYVLHDVDHPDYARPSLPAWMHAGRSIPRAFG
jgi:hypothetical protein